MEELLPLAFAGAGQVMGRGEGQDEFPCAALGPVVEGGDGGGIILVQGGLELVDQGRALRDERDFIAAEQAQLVGERILRAQRTPAVPVGAQGVGEAEGVEAIGLAAGGSLAVAEAFGGLGIEREDGKSRLQQSFDSGPAVGLDSKADDGG